MFNTYWYDEERFMQPNSLDRLVHLCCKILKWDRPKSTKVFQQGAMYRGLEKIVKGATLNTTRLDKSPEISHLTGTADLEESCYITNFRQSYYSMKKNDKMEYLRFKQQAYNIGLASGALLLGVTVLPIMYYLTQAIEPTYRKLELLNYEIVFSPEIAIMIGFSAVLAWAAYSTVYDAFNIIPKFVNKIREIKSIGNEVFSYISGTNISVGERNRSIAIAHEAIEEGYGSEVKEYLYEFADVGREVWDSINILSYKSIGDRIKELAKEINDYQKGPDKSDEADKLIERKARIIHIYQRGHVVEDKEKDIYFVPTELLEKEIENISYTSSVKRVVSRVVNGENISTLFSGVNLNWRENYFLRIEVMDTDPNLDRKEHNIRRKLCDTVYNIINPPPDAAHQQSQLGKYAGGVTNIFKVLKKNPGWKYYNPFRVAELLKQGDLALARLYGYTEIKVLGS